MDFFTATAAGSDALAAVSSPTQLPAPTTSNHDSTTTDAFAEAINARYSRKGSTVLIPLSPASEHPSASPPNSSIAVPTHKLQAPAMASASSSSSEEFIAVNPTSVRDVLEGALVIDIRSHNAYALARLPHALSLSVPSTLLKRPLFSLDKLAQMLSSVPARERFSRWPEAPSILVYDADSGVLNEGGNLVGLLRKFRKEGFTRKLYWLKGGFKAVWREVLDVVDQNPMVEEDDVPAVAAPTPSGTLLPKHLPMRAFTMASTTTSRQVPLTPAVNQGSVDPFSLRLPQAARTSHPNMTLPLPSTPAASTSSSFSRPSSLSLHLPPASKPTTIPEGKTLHLFPPAQRSAVDVSSLPTGGQSAAYNVVPRPHYKSMPGGHSMAFNPFFDNIRQNIELSGGRGSGEGIPLKLPRRVRRRVEELPFEWLREIGRRSGTVVDETEESSDMDVVVENEAKGVAHNATSAVNISRSIVAGTKKSKKRRRKTKQSSNLTRLHPSSSSSSSSSESNSPPPDSSELSYSASPSKANSKAGSASPPPGLASISLNPLTTQPQAATSSPQVTTTDPSEGESSGDDLAKALAMQFYKIELGEQRRLMGVMEHHSKESTTFSTSAQSTAPSSSSGALPGGYAGVRVLPGLKSGMPMGNSTSSSGSSSNATVQPRSVTTSTSSVSQASTSKSEEGAAQIAFPYSITAGVEKGEKNRYRNIWPFEHARVRLQKSCPEDDDYMNASYVQPLGTNKRYIATQGPLPATFTDFWTLCWQENVHVIVMLTREVESALIKCGNYWNEGDYGSLQLKLISTTDSPEREKRRKERESSSGFFNFPQVPEVQRPGEQHEDHTIRRIFQLTNKKYPQAKPRIVTQLQYLDWPDLDVPKDPRGLLELMKEVDEIVENTRVEGGMQWGEGPWNKSPIGTPPKEQRPPSVETLGGRGDVDPVTGVATHAVGRAPVLLHCSAGVGRTGGFIAVDAVLDGVRREMRKRRQQQQQYQVKSDVSSVASSQSQSPSSLPGEEHAERMDVDRGPFDKAVDTGLTMPMEVGGNEVHVPIAGLRNGQAPMDVDSVDANSKKDGQFKLKASPALLKEVKTGHAKAIAALADNDRHSASHPPATPDNHGEIAQAESPQRDVGPSDSSSGASSTPRSTSLSTRSVMSSNHTSTTSLTQAVKAVDPTLGSSDSSSSLQQDKSTVRVASSSTSQAGPAMDSWRTVGPKWERDVVLASPRGMAFDYVEPRRLHDNRSPPLLSSYDEPIRRVIEDMREQRMSLCQSLRQYVFVHRAIIEGVLKIMDEEKNRKRGTVEDVEMAVADTDKSVRPPSMPSVFGKPAATSKSSDMLVSPMPLRPPGLDRAENIGLGPALVLDEHGARRTPLSQESPLLEVLIPTGSPMSPRTKRQASPTELVSEDSQGAPRLTKRASVKRRPATPRVSKDEDSGVQLGSLMLSSPPPA